MERETGIEPATNSLGSCDSTTELLPLNDGASILAERVGTPGEVPTLQTGQRGPKAPLSESAAPTGRTPSHILPCSTLGQSCSGSSRLPALPWKALRRDC